MEDGACDFVTNAETQDIKNGTVPSVMTNFPEGNVSSTKEDTGEVFDKFNGDSNIESNTCEDEYSSESDALVIDESVPKKIPNKRKQKSRSKNGRKTVKDAELITHSNPFFNESLYELSQQHQNSQTETSTLERTEVKVNNCKVHKHKKGKNKSPKREYAQYLGLQPTVQFKCSKCGQAGFETLTTLNDHIVQCDAIPSLQQPTTDNSVSSIKLTRKVFLCSACGTYYENWNLYLHMLELHRRFICLYCLGMFSAPNDLCQHIQSRHNLQPGHKNSLDEFFNVYSEPCYVVCCECNKLFSEEDNFFYHNCIKSNHLNNKSNQKMLTKGKTAKVHIRPENHVTGDSGGLSQELTDQSTNNGDQNTNLAEVKQSSTFNNNHDSGESIVPLPTPEKEIRNINFEITDNVDSFDKQNSEDTSVAKEISNNLDTSVNNDIHISNDSNNENGSDYKIQSDSPTHNLDREHLSSEEEEIQLEDPPASHNISPKTNSFVNSLEESEPNDKENDIFQDVSNQERFSESLPAPVPSESNYEVPDDVSKEDDYGDYGNEGDDEDDNNEDTDQFSENELDEATAFSDHDDNTGSLMDSSEKLRLDSSSSEKLRLDGSQDEKLIMETSEPERLTEGIEGTEIRKVPKLSLKLPKPGPCKELSNDSDDSEKLTMEVDQMESESEANISSENKTTEETIPNSNLGPNVSFLNYEPNLQVAGVDVNIVELQLEQPLDKFDVKVLLQKCLKATAPICVYCNHARKIAVNGKQLGLHAIGEHRYSAIVNSITAEELMPETFVARIRENLDELADVFFSLESGVSGEGVTFSHVFECFQCRYSTTVHKELYLHNRKLHTKNLLLCIMCKSNFYSYSELICHLCPGVYVLDYDIQFRCCMCVSDDLPSAFRLMVHLRKRHHVCDVCLEVCHNQYKLSNHVWKHKLHHFCYRCGIAYRNKPDITRHLFWKHGTESVLCKKCLQKKWPHVYHFCVPPSSFSCDECNLTFTKAVSLKVHKRIHSDEKPHACTIDDCKERFVSKKLLAKHEMKHREPEEEVKPEIVVSDTKQEESDVTFEKPLESIENESKQVELKVEEKPKPKVDVYDLPELNLSESDSDSEDETIKQNKTEETNAASISDETSKTEGMLQFSLLGNVCSDDILQEDKMSLLDNVMEKSAFDDFEPSEKIPPILENIWDDFKNYQAEKEKIDHMFTDKDKIEETEVIEAAKNEGLNEEKSKLTVDVALLDHDYCYVTESQIDTSITEAKPDLSQRVDHDYCSPKRHGASSPTKSTGDKATLNEEVKLSPKKRTESTSSNSSSSSDSSSCTCGSNCSCTSSSGSSSSSSDSSDSDSSTEEGRKRQQLKRERRKEKSKNKKSEIQKEPEVTSVHQPPPVVEVPIQESDLDTTESETDEEFYDKQPQKLAKKILEEKRNQLLAEVGTVLSDTWLETSRPATPNLPEEDAKPKKKSKSKKKKKRKSIRKEQTNQDYTAASDIPTSTYYQCYQQPSTVAPITLTIRNSPVPSQSSTIVQSTPFPKSNEPTATNTRIDDSHLRASKRRRVPNKFYGYSSDEETEKGPAHHTSKWRKQDVHPPPQTPLTVPPITIKTTQLLPQSTIEPLTIRPAAQTGELRVHQRPAAPVRLPPPKTFIPPVLAPQRQLPRQLEESGSESNESSTEETHKSPDKPPQPQLYCYCRCPYDEVSEMIGCDASDCAIEWFHFECVGIMVPPKGQWFCPDCRKKKQQRRETLQT